MLLASAPTTLVLGLKDVATRRGRAIATVLTVTLAVTMAVAIVALASNARELLIQGASNADRRCVTGSSEPPRVGELFGAPGHLGVPERIAASGPGTPNAGCVTPFGNSAACLTSIRAHVRGRLCSWVRPEPSRDRAWGDDVAREPSVDQMTTSVLPVAER
jgi:hypothetical protein